MTPFGDNDIIVVDLGFGDAGKGATVDYLCSPDADLNVSAVVRFNGGAQAAHNVVVDGRHHTFSQFGSGTFSGVSTILSRSIIGMRSVTMRSGSAISISSARRAFRTCPIRSWHTPIW